jgi:hypothetical protein
MATRLTSCMKATGHEALSLTINRTPVPSPQESIRKASILPTINAKTM